MRVRPYSVGVCTYSRGLRGSWSGRSVQVSGTVPERSGVSYVKINKTFRFLGGVAVFQ
jgi:hypothetical protein